MQEVASTVKALPKGVVREGVRYAQARSNSATKAVVLDYQLVNGQTLTFQGNQTYLVMGPVTLTGTITIEGGRY